MSRSRSQPPARRNGSTSLADPRQFRRLVESQAAQQLADMIGSEQGQRAATRVALAFSSALRAARDPGALLRCSPASVAAAVAMSALTEIMPGGPAAGCWLIPRGGELQWQLSHRGIAALCLRAGYQTLAIPVHADDHLRVEFGEVAEHESDPDRWPESLDDLAGVYVTVRQLSTGTVLCRPWLPRPAIERRQTSAQSQAVWRAWPVEMAQKTAIHWAIARGYLPIQGLEMSLALDADLDASDAQTAAIETAPGTATATSPPLARQLAQDPFIPADDPAPRREREPIPAASAEAEEEARLEREAMQAEQSEHVHNPSQSAPQDGELFPASAPSEPDPWANGPGL